MNIVPIPPKDLQGLKMVLKMDGRASLYSRINPRIKHHPSTGTSNSEGWYYMDWPHIIFLLCASSPHSNPIIFKGF